MRPLPPLDPPPTDGVLALRRWRPADVPQIAAACVDPEIQRWTLVPAGYEERDARDFLARGDAGWTDGTLASLAVVAVDDPATVLGAVGFGRPDWQTGRAGEAGYWVVPAARGRGVASGGLELLTRWAFGALGLRRLELQVIAGNVASERVAVRAGYRRVGVDTATTKQGEVAVTVFARDAALPLRAVILPSADRPTPAAPVSAPSTARFPRRP
ncbi:GNAT family N-acetyltransferase [Conexibacter arvalis]|uniref:RimJ/RimL family protein N-acetyltransferase n=1 Tax=Conexibacter arvalis TaxID=912552 RepID=A0A840IL83_9ACTN|nr:GNAT family protein [Conexibacter arvalis]MBB4664670.1 RimJ/RimL family protein N-acetyltransferase [Conexibacter arvalis]